MFRILLNFTLFLNLLLILSYSSFAEIDEAKKKELIEIQSIFLKSIENGSYTDAINLFDDTMKEQIDEKGLEKMWLGLDTQFGKLKKNIDRVFTEYTDPSKGITYNILLSTDKYEKSALTMRLVFNQDNLISGLFFQPASNPSELKRIPDYADTNSFTEKEIIIGKNGKWPLPGTITLPKKGDNLPSVVLVHGSGANDRDESVGPNKPFRDIAYGLATNGIAVLRYEKRSREYASLLKDSLTLLENITLNWLTVDDAILASEFAKTLDRISPDKIYMLGHSLGGYALPRIASKQNNYGGYIMLAGSARSLTETIMDQYNYIFNIDKKLTKDEISTLNKTKELIAKIEDPNLKKDSYPGEILLGARPDFWLDLRNYNPVELAKKIDKPLLILQGKRDYQVTVEDDFNKYKKALQGKTNVKFILYPDLNHLFMFGYGAKALPSEYQAAGHVDKKVINDISKWIKSQ